MPCLVVLAAGMGSRYGGLKQIDPIGPSGEFILDYSIYDAIRSGFKKVLFVISKQLEGTFKNEIQQRYEGRIEVDFAIQELAAHTEEFTPPSSRSKPWGTGHAILCCKNQVDSPFAVINADDYYGHHSFSALGDFLSQCPKDKNNFAMVAFLLKNTLSEHGSVSRGVCEVEDLHLKYVTEYPVIEKTEAGGRFPVDKGWGDLSPDTPVSMNLWGFTPGIFDILQDEFNTFLSQRGGEEKSEFYIPNVVGDSIKREQAQVKVFESKDQWFGITYSQDKAFAVQQISQLIENKTYPSQLWS